MNYMKFYFENLGLLEKAEIELSNLTIVCGENNTGKTYATYAIYGFLKSWRRFIYPVLANEIGSLIEGKNNYKINLENIFKGKINFYLNKLSEQYISTLPEVFASREDAFTKTKMQISIENEKSILEKSFQRRLGVENTFATITKKENSPELEILIAEENDYLFGFVDFIIDAITEIIFAPYFPNTHISSAERTGAAIFRKELDMARTRVLKAINEMDSKDIKNKPWSLFQKIDADYAWPVEDNVDFVRQLEEIDKQVSDLSKNEPEILSKFDEIIGGSYKVLKNQGLVFQAKGSKNKKYTMNEASSCTRALLDVGFYIRCRAKIGDLFIIDEPELNLHPKNQRAFARLIAQLINAGIKVFITTHSDYLIKEINTLIMLNQKTDHTRKIQQKYDYSDKELINHETLNLYMTAKAKKSSKLNHLKKAKIYPNLGIDVTTFDDTIETMNAIQNDLLYGE